MKTARTAIFREWKYDESGACIWAVDDKGDVICKISDVRGMGYLTGKGSGGLGLSYDEAEIVQNQIGRLIASAPNMVKLLKACIHEAEENEEILTSSMCPEDADSFRKMLDIVRSMFSQWEAKA